MAKSVSNLVTSCKKTGLLMIYRRFLLLKAFYFNLGRSESLNNE